jgi:hypothetical protein
MNSNALRPCVAQAAARSRAQREPADCVLALAPRRLALTMRPAASWSGRRIRVGHDAR